MRTLLLRHLSGCFRRNSPRPWLQLSSTRLVLARFLASVAKLNIDSELMTQSYPPHRYIKSGRCFVCFESWCFQMLALFSQRLAISSLLLPLSHSSALPFSCSSLKWYKGCVQSLHSYCCHVERTRSSLMLRSNLNLSTASPQNFSTQTVRCLQCRSVGSTSPK